MLSVLVVDDDPALLHAMREYLSRIGKAQVRVARTSHEGMSILSSNTFDAIVLDYDLPEIDGLAFLKIIRSRGDVTPVIIFTGAGREHTAIEALNAGADFYVKKGEKMEDSLRPVLDRIEQAVDGRIGGRPIGVAQKTLNDAIRFSSDPTFAIDRDKKVISWNEAMEQLTGVSATDMLKKGDYSYAEPFFGRPQRMLIDLVFESDDGIQNQRYLVISRVKNGPVVAVTRGVRPDGQQWTLWMKAEPLYDLRGNFIASISSVRDITATVRDLPLPEPEAAVKTSPEITATDAQTPTAAGGGLLNRILGKATTAYAEGVRLYTRELKYREAIAAFDAAIAAEPDFANAWNDRGICYLELGEYDAALKSFVRAVELAPDSVEILYDLGETLEKIGILQRDDKYLDAALQTFHMVVDKVPNNASAWNHIGVCLKEMGKAEESKVYFERAHDVRVWKKDTPISRKRDEFL